MKKEKKSRNWRDADSIPNRSCCNVSSCFLNKEQSVVQSPNIANLLPNEYHVRLRSQTLKDNFFINFVFRKKTSYKKGGESVSQ